MLFFCLFAAAAHSAGAAENGVSLPRITKLEPGDPVFEQFLEDVEASRRRIFLGRSSADELAALVTIYSYIPAEKDEIMSLAARCNIPYGTIASINGLSHPQDLETGRVMLIPSMPGLFIPEDPYSSLERLFDSSREGGVSVSVDGKKFRFFPGEDLNPTERIFFLNRGFSFPLAGGGRLSSPYGFRVNPVTGRAGIHRGVDLAAPQGTPVYATRAGTVSAAGNDPVFGLYVIITHADNWISLYGHLSEITTALNEKEQSGSLIGKVGSTGQSTGPHLHFELRQNGRAIDPGKLLRLFGEAR